MPLRRSESGGDDEDAVDGLLRGERDVLLRGPRLRLDRARDERLLARRVALEAVGGGVPQRGLGHALEDGAAGHRLPLQRVREAERRGAERRDEREGRDARGRERRDLARDAAAEGVAREEDGLLGQDAEDPARERRGLVPVGGLRTAEGARQVQRLDREVLRERDAGVRPVGRAAAEPVQEDEDGFRLLGGHRGEC